MCKRCETCKWWVNPWYGTDDGWKMCELTEQKGARMVHPESLAYAASLDETELLTHATFWCVQWKEKTE